MNSALCRVYADGGQFHQGIVWNSLNDLVSYLNNNFSHDFYGHDFGESNRSSAAYSDDDAGEEAFVKDVMQDLDYNNQLIADDNVVISHGALGFGYGGGAYTVQLDDGGTATGHAVYAGSLVPAWEVRGFTWHELVHTMGPWHGAANVDTTGGEMHSITPLGMGYVHDEDSQSDTLYSATDGSQNGAPSDFCYGEENFYYSGYEYNDQKKNHDLGRLSYCSEDQISNWISNR